MVGSFLLVRGDTSLCLLDLHSFNPRLHIQVGNGTFDFIGRSEKNCFQNGQQGFIGGDDFKRGDDMCYR